MEFIILNEAIATEEQLLAAINSNVRTARLMSSEIEKLKQNTKKRGVMEPEITLESISEEQPQLPVQIDSSFEELVAFYYATIKDLTPEELEELPTELLPSKDDYQYERIMNRLTLEILKNIKEIKEYLKTEELSDEDADTLAEEIISEEEKLAVIKNHMEQTEEKQETTSQAPVQNNIIFVPTTGGNIRVLDELDKISPEYYARFFDLFQSIKDGTFKNEQRLRGDTNLAGLSVVRYFNIRVAYTRLDENNYAVLTAYIKKADRDKAVTTSLSSKYGDYKAVEPKLIANLQNPDFIDLNKQYEEELFNKLAPHTKKEAEVKTKKVGE